MLYLSEENKIKLIKRFKSFVWRAGMAVVVGLMAFALDNVGLLELGAMEVIVSGVLAYVLSEVTKYYNTTN
ncbi:MAG: hypothetical protein QQN63_06820 [Nitrosopumilus sp.]